ncbi:PREDICTED: uncharacterized protein LOC105148109 [Acromyrmex echinatior]|uniref:uncharacterized protein LOC105148109 n=1 Tax=Acromyrmex echinatior TaxID=103372 RepID=UPI0005810231|nr:PREDICTED: uncharacterized protein LOC105148109 [Acromyrmex echinatior]
MGFCRRRGSSPNFVIQDHRRILLQKRTIVKDHHRTLSQKGSSRNFITEDHRGTLLQKRITSWDFITRGSSRYFVIQDHHRIPLQKRIIVKSHHKRIIAGFHRRSSWDLEAEDDHIMGFCRRRGSSPNFVIQDHRRILLQKRTIVKDHHRTLSQKGSSRNFITEDHRGTLLQKRITSWDSITRGSLRDFIIQDHHRILLQKRTIVKDHHRTLSQKGSSRDFIAEEDHRGILKQKITSWDSVVEEDHH